MAIKKDSLTKILKALRLDDATITDLIDSTDEKDFDIHSDISIFNKNEIESRDRNKYNEGKKAGGEISIKELKKKAAVELEGEDLDNFLDAYKKKLEGENSKNIDTRLTERDKQIEKLKATQKELEATKQKLEADMLGFKNDSKMLSYFPANATKLLSREEQLALIRSRFSIENREGKDVVLKDGTLVTDAKTGDPIEPLKVIQDFFTERNWVDIEGGDGFKGGRGGGNSGGAGTGGKFSKISEVEKYIEEQGWSPNGQQAVSFLQAAAKENPNMDLSS